MTDNMKRFYEEASRNGELREKLMAVGEPSVGSVLAIAKEYGFDISEDDFKEGGSCRYMEISFDELDAVSGGGESFYDIEGNPCFCILGGGKNGEDKAACACVIPGAKTGFGCGGVGWVHD